MAQSSFFDVTIENPTAPRGYRSFRLRRVECEGALSAVKKAYHKYFGRSQRRGYRHGDGELIIRVRNVGEGPTVVQVLNGTE